MFFIRKEIIRAFKRGIFLYIDGYNVEKESDEESDKESDKESDEELDENKFFNILRINQKVLTMNCKLQSNYIKV